MRRRGYNNMRHLDAIETERSVKAIEQLPRNSMVLDAPDFQVCFVVRGGEEIEILESHTADSGTTFGG